MGVIEIPCIEGVRDPELVLSHIQRTDMAVLEWTRALGRHSPRCIKGPPLRSEEKISSPELSLRVMQPQGGPNDDTQYQCMFRACPPSEGIQLTTPAGDIRSQDEASQFVGVTMTSPLYWAENYPMLGGVVVVDPLSFTQGHPGQWYLPQHPPHAYTPDQRPKDLEGLFPPVIGGNTDRDIAVGCPSSIPLEDIGPSCGDPGVSPRYGTDPEGHIHLTTNISMAWSWVSYPHLVEEVCRHSASKTHWY